jgi:hypothetical protein
MILRTSWEVNQNGLGCIASERLSFTRLGKAFRGKPRSKPESGNPTFRDCRGARGNVTFVSYYMVRAPRLYPDPGNWFAPLGSNRSGSGGNEAVGSLRCRGSPFVFSCFRLQFAFQFEVGSQLPDGSQRWREALSARASLTTSSQCRIKASSRRKVGGAPSTAADTFGNSRAPAIVRVRCRLWRSKAGRDT